VIRFDMNERTSRKGELIVSVSVEGRVLGGRHSAAELHERAKRTLLGFVDSLDRHQGRVFEEGAFEVKGGLLSSRVMLYGDLVEPPEGPLDAATPPEGVTEGDLGPIERRKRQAKADMRAERGQGRSAEALAAKHAHLVGQRVGHTLCSEPGVPRTGAQATGVVQQLSVNPDAGTCWVQIVRDDTGDGRLWSVPAEEVYILADQRFVPGHRVVLRDTLGYDGTLPFGSVGTISAVHTIGDLPASSLEVNWDRGFPSLVTANRVVHHVEPE
jgi:hypothetical protein